MRNLILLTQASRGVQKLFGKQLTQALTFPHRMIQDASVESRPTIRTLAKLAEVSNATVSLALRNHPRIRPEVRERIQRIAALAGYKSNPLVANLLVQLRASKTTAFQSTLGLLYLGPEVGLLSAEPTFQSWVKGCRDRASALGHGLDQFSLFEPGLSPGRLAKILYARNIQGVVVIGPFEKCVIPRELDPIWERTAAVVIGVRPERPALAFVSNDQFSTAVKAVKEVVRLGYRRPGLCLHPDVDDWVEDRFSGGFLAAQRKLPCEDRLPPFDYRTPAQEPKAHARFKAWMKSQRPDVILTVHREIESWLRSMGIRVPRDMGLVHLDKTDNVAWAGIQQNSELVGRAAVDMVIGQLHRNEFGVPPFQKCMFIGGNWVFGPTVKRRKRPAAKD